MFGLDFSVDDYISGDNANGFSWNDTWNKIAGSAENIFDNAVEWGENNVLSNFTEEGDVASNDAYKVEQPTEAVNANAPAGSATGGNNANHPTSGVMGGFELTTTHMLIGGGLIIGAVVLAKVL